MSRRSPDRGSLTTLLLQRLETIGFPVGDAAAPEHDETGPNAGWNGEPNAPGSVFVPYIVLSPQTATVSSGPISGPQEDWRLPFTLAFFGVSREQTEALANRGRQVLEALSKTTVTLDTVSFKIQQIWFDALGGVGRVDATSPSTFGEVDTFTVWLAQ